MLEHALNQMDSYIESEESTTGGTTQTHPKKKSGSSKCTIQ